MDVRQQLARKANEGNNAVMEGKRNSVSMEDMIHAMEPEIKKALPEVITPERFTRMAINALNATPGLRECTPVSFIAALMNAAQLGLEPNTPLGQAYLIPYKNSRKGIVECQFQIGYRGMIDLVYRNENVQTIQAQIVRKNDEFEYELGLNSKLRHVPALHDRGEMTFVYAFYKLQNGGYAFEVLNREGVIAHAERYSKQTSNYSPWRVEFEAMAMKTAIKKVLKFAPLKTEISRAIASDETIKSEIGEDMTEINGEEYIYENTEGETDNEKKTF